MARYRIGDRYLSESEYNQEQDGSWIFGLFLVGAIVVGLLVNRYVVNPEWHTAIRFLVTVVPAVIAGAFLQLSIVGSGCYWVLLLACWCLW